MGKRLDFAQVQKDFDNANTLNKLNAEYRGIIYGYELSNKQDTAIWNMYCKRRARLYVALTKQGAEGFYSQEFLQAYGDMEVVA